MESSIILFVDGVPAVKFMVEKVTKIGELKHVLQPYIKSDKPKVEFFINPKNRMDVFDTDKFDSVNLESVWNMLEQPRIEITNSCSSQTCKPSLYKNNRKVEKWQSLLDKFNKWRELDVPMFTLFPFPNIYDLLYNHVGNGNHDTLGSYLINDSTLRKKNEKKRKYFDELYTLTPAGIFGEEGILSDLVSSDAVDAILDHEYRPFDYNYLLQILEKERKSIEEYEELLGESSDYIKHYPELYADKLKENPAMNDMQFLKENIRKKTDDLVKFISEQSGSSAKDLYLTDEEIDLLLDLHRRILDKDPKVNILTQATAENLA